MKTKLMFHCVLLFGILLLPFGAYSQKAEQPLVRWPAFAGINYPAEPEILLSTVRGFFDQADTPEIDARLTAVIASAAPYGLAGPVSAHAFKSLKPGQYERVIVLASSHGPMFEYCSIPAVDIFLTPLGPVPLDAPAVRYLLYSPLFHAHRLRYQGGRPGDQIHEYEFSIESVLPYLQERLLEFKLVPLLVGDLRDPQGRVSEGTIRAVADAIRPIVNERTLIVVASSFTHYGSEYSDLVFQDNVEEGIARLDRRAFEPILALSLAEFRDYLRETRNIIDGQIPIQILLSLLPRHTQPRILAYETSMTKTGEKNRSVSYAAFVFHDPRASVLSPQPDKVRPLVLRRPERIMKPEGLESPAEGAELGTPGPSATANEEETPQ